MQFVTGINKGSTILFMLSLGALLVATPGCTADDIDGLEDDQEVSADDEEAVAEATSAITWSGHTYWFRPEPLSWANAKESCASKGYYLVTINSSTEQSWLHDQIVNRGGGWWWLGYNDRTQEGFWEWVKGSPLYTHWQPGQPESGSSQDCAFIKAVNGRWYDGNCGSTQYYICEKN